MEFYSKILSGNNPVVLKVKAKATCPDFPRVRGLQKKPASVWKICFACEIKKKFLHSSKAGKKSNR